MLDLTQILLISVICSVVGVAITIAKTGGILGKSSKKSLKNGVDEATKNYAETLLTVNKAQRDEIKRLQGANSRAKRQIYEMAGEGDDPADQQVDTEPLKPLLKQLNIPEAALTLPQVQKFIKNKDNLELISQLGPLLTSFKSANSSKTNQPTTDTETFA